MRTKNDKTKGLRPNLPYGKNYYKQKITELVEKIENEEFLEKIYYFIKVFLENE